MAKCIRDLLAGGIVVLSGLGLLAAQSRAATCSPTTLIAVPAGGSPTLLATSAVVATGANCPPPLFSGPLTSPGPANFQALVEGDFNGDGAPDLAVTTAYSSNGLQIFLGAADGTFTLESTSFQGVSVGPLAVADLNNDGHLDLVLGSAQELIILLGNGDGTFTEVPNSAFFPDWSYSIATGDFNGDGFPDLAVGLQGSGMVEVLLGNGDGTFASPVPYTTAAETRSVLVGDFDLDGALDIVTCGPSSSSVTALFGRGDGTFDPGQSVLIGSGPFSLVTGDFNGDGKLDIAALLDSFGPVQGISVVLNAGNREFLAPIEFPAPPTSTQIAVEDYNEDGALDLGILSGTPGYNGPLPAELSVFIGDGTGSFSPGGPIWLAGEGGQGFVALDTNGDGHLDIVEGGYGSSNLWTLLGNGNGTFLSSFELPLAQSAATIIPADFNGDGKVDLLAVLDTPFSSTFFLEALIGDGTGGFQQGVTIPAGTTPGAGRVGDFNGDGRPDLFDVSYGSGTVSIFPGIGDGTFGDPVVTDIGSYYNYVSPPVIGDFNGDGKLDFLFFSGYGLPQNLLEYPGDGDGSFGPSITQAFDIGYPVDLRAVDLNGDGALDLIVSDGSNDVWVFLGNGDGTFGDPFGYAVLSGSGALALGDFNGDGFLDLLVSNTGATAVSLLPGNGDGTFRSATNIWIGESAGQVVAADFDRDGFLDFAATGANDIWTYRGLGNGTFYSPELFLTGSGPSSLVESDLRGTGASDLITANGGDSAIGILLNGRLAVSNPSPNSEGACTGDSASFTAIGSGTGFLSYQWRRNGLDLADGGEFSGTHTPVLTISPAGLADAASYDVVVADLCTQVTSAEASLTVSQQPTPPVITAPLSVPPDQPGVGVSVPAVAGHSFDWTVTGGTITSGQGTHAILLTAGPAGTTMSVQVVEMASAGCGSAPSTALIQVDFADVPASNPFHNFVDTLARDGLTAGCGAGNFCPSDAVLRSSMAVFLLRAEHGSAYVPPPAIGLFGDVPASNPFAPWIEEIYNEGITGGCSTNPLEYCPNSVVTRAGMAVFLLRAEHGSTYTPPAAVGIFGDVPASNPFAPWIEQLYSEGITGGCSTNPLLYCPANSVTRAQMAVFLVATFNLQ